MKRPARPMTANEWEVLRDIAAFKDNMRRLGTPDKFARPLDVGGFDGSHHSYTLIKLASRYMVECKKFGSGSRGSHRYRITYIGEAMLQKGKA